MNRRSFLRSLGVLLVAPATLVRAASAAKPNRIVNPDMRIDEGHAFILWSCQCGKTELMGRMTEYHMANGSRIMCYPIHTGPIRGYNAHCAMIDDGYWTADASL